MTRKIGVIILILLLVMPSIIALDSEFRFKTVSKAILDIRFQNSLTGKTLSDGEFLDIDADSNGIVAINYSTEESSLKISVMGTDVNGNPLLFAGNPTVWIKGVITGDMVFIDLTKETPTPVYEELHTQTNTSDTDSTEEEEIEVNNTEVNETEEAATATPEENVTTTENTEEIEQETENIEPRKAFFSRDNLKNLIIIGVIILIILIFGPVIFLVATKRVKLPKSKNIKITKLSDKASKKDAKEYDLIKSAEDRIKEAQGEIEELKKRIKAKDIEKRIEDDQKELRKLRGY